MLPAKKNRSKDEEQKNAPAEHDILVERRWDFCPHLDFSSMKSDVN
jgi:hypothetical protein